MRLVLLLLALLAMAPAAQATDEIQVYTGEVAPDGEWELAQHLNYGFFRRPKGENPALVTSGRTLNGTPELAYGIGAGQELGLYLPFAAREDRFFPGGAKLRYLVVSESIAARGYALGLNTELSWAPRRFSRSRWNAEFRPILGVNSGRWQVLVNPIVGIGLGGKQPDAFLPATRVFYRVAEDFSLGVETYSDLGSFGHFGKFRQQAHSVFGAVEFTLFGLDVNLGLGHGVTRASEGWIAKTIIAASF